MRSNGAALATAAAVALLQYSGTRLDWVSIPLALLAVALLVPTLPRLLPAGALRLARGLPTAVAMRGFLAAVVRKKLKLKLDSKKIDGSRVYNIKGADGSKASGRQSKRRAA